MIDGAVGLMLSGVLVFVIVEDLRRFRIRNGIVLLLATGFFAACLAQGRLAVIMPHLLFALLGFGLLFAAFVGGLIGGGDAKLLSVALLWIGPEGAFVFGVSLLAFALAYVAGAKLHWLPSRRKSHRTEIPFGPSIAAAWISVQVLSAYIAMRPDAGLGS